MKRRGNNFPLKESSPSEILSRINELHSSFSCLFFAPSDDISIRVNNWLTSGRYIIYFPCNRHIIFLWGKDINVDILLVCCRSLDWTGCCCSGAGAAGNDNLVASTSSRYLESSTGCPDVKGYHPPIHICSLLANMPSSVSLDSGCFLISCTKCLR